MVPQNHLSFSKASTSTRSTESGCWYSSGFYLLPKRASENSSLKSTSCRPRFSLTTGHGMTVKLSASRPLTGFKATHWTETCTQSQLRTTPKARLPPSGPAGATTAQWMAPGSLRIVHSGSLGLHAHHSQIFKEKWLSLAQYGGGTRRMCLFLKQKATLQHSNSQIIAFGLKHRLLG